MSFLLADPETRAIVVYLEGWLKGEARAFCDAVRLSANRKPVILLQPGDTDAGRRAALSTPDRSRAKRGSRRGRSRKRES